MQVEEYKDQIFDLLNNGAHMYFCGLKGMMPARLPPQPPVAPSLFSAFDSFGFGFRLGRRLTDPSTLQGILEMLENVCKEKGLNYEEFIEGLKHKGQWCALLPAPLCFLLQTRIFPPPPLPRPLPSFTPLLPSVVPHPCWHLPRPDPARKKLALCQLCAYV